MPTAFLNWCSIVLASPTCWSCNLSFTFIASYFLAEVPNCHALPGFDHSLVHASMTRLLFHPSYQQCHVDNAAKLGCWVKMYPWTLQQHCGGLCVPLAIESKFFPQQLFWSRTPSATISVPFSLQKQTCIFTRWTSRGRVLPSRHQQSKRFIA